jgi:Asparagine synthase
MRLVDLGESEITEHCELAGMRASWAYWEGSAQWRIRKSPASVLVIEGQPDRYPHAGESIEHWLAGRSGSFRGFELVETGAGGLVRIFTDPLCTRPVYYLISGDSVCIADKLSSVVLNSGGDVEPDWEGLLESAVLGSLYSHRTTVKDAVWLEPGEAIEFRGSSIGRRWKNPLPVDPTLAGGSVMERPVETLRLAIEKAISETWTDPQTRLLLSGGLDSRIVLALARGQRKALTLELYSSETEIARRVAEAAEACLDIVAAPDYEYPLRWGYLVTGAMHDSRFLTHLGLEVEWRRRGITGITHGYFHNTMYRGWTAGPIVRFPNKDSILFEWMGPNAYYFDQFGARPASLPRQFYGLLSEEGKLTLRRQLRSLSDSIERVVQDGYDLTFERRLLAFVSRQVYFSNMLAWYEALDVASPVFQPAIWTWYALSHPRHRDRDWAIREVFLSLDHPAAKLPDANTGQPIAHLPFDWRDRVRNRFWYPAFRAAHKRLFGKPQAYQEGGMQWGSRLREPASLAVVRDGVGVLRENPLFDPARVQQALDSYCAGANWLVDTIVALMTVGQWQRLVSRPDLETEKVRVFNMQGRNGRAQSN